MRALLFFQLKPRVFDLLLVVALRNPAQMLFYQLHFKDASYISEQDFVM